MSTCRKYRQVRQEGNRQVSREIPHYINIAKKNGSIFSDTAVFLSELLQRQTSHKLSPFVYIVHTELKQQTAILIFYTKK
jgi:hypothetical protein